MADGDIQYIQFPDELSRLRYTIAKYKEHDKKRNRYVAHLQRMYEQQREKVKRLEALTEHQHEEIDELMAAYDGAKPLISDKSHRAYVYELLKKAIESSNNKREAERLNKANIRLNEENESLKERNKALEQIIKNLHNGK